MTSVETLQREIARLKQEQEDALQLSVYVGMSPAEAQEYEIRKKRIFDLLRQLRNLPDQAAAQAN